MANTLIGIIGGLGPFAGLDFVQKIFRNTKALKDQDHIDCMLVSCASIIPDRTEFLLGKESENPALGMFESAKKLYAAGVRLAVIACNTAHAERIFKPFSMMIQEALPDFTVLNMIKLCADYVKEKLPACSTIGLLATKGVYASGVYQEYFTDGFKLLEPDAEGKERIHNAIYNKDYGIKTCSSPVHSKAHAIVIKETVDMKHRGAEAIILGCTELPLAVQEAMEFPLIDPALIAARALIGVVAPAKLLPQF
jgi:aspartate racemase